MSVYLCLCVNCDVCACTWVMCEMYTLHMLKDIKFFYCSLHRQCLSLKLKLAFLPPAFTRMSVRKPLTHCYDVSDFCHLPGPHSTEVINTGNHTCLFCVILGTWLQVFTHAQQKLLHTEHVLSPQDCLYTCYVRKLEDENFRCILIGIAVIKVWNSKANGLN